MTLSVPLSPYVYGRVYCVVRKCKKRYDRTRHASDDYNGREEVPHSSLCRRCQVQYIKCSSHKRLAKVNAAIDTVQSHPVVICLICSLMSSVNHTKIYITESRQNHHFTLSITSLTHSLRPINIVTNILSDASSFVSFYSCRYERVIFCC